MKRRKFIVLILENIETDFLHAIRPPFRGSSDVPPSKPSRFAKNHSSYNCICGISYTHHCIQLRNYPASIKVVLLLFFSYLHSKSIKDHDRRKKHRSNEGRIVSPLSLTSVTHATARDDASLLFVSRPVYNLH